MARWSTFCCNSLLEGCGALGTLQLEEYNCKITVNASNNWSNQRFETVFETSGKSPQGSLLLYDRFPRQNSAAKLARQCMGVKLFGIPAQLP